MERSKTSLFQPVVESAKLNPAFVQVSTSAASRATRRMMDETFVRMGPREPNFVEQFQTTGFDQRVWELALFPSLVELGFDVELPDPAPDFACTQGDTMFFIEATTANAPMVDGKRVEPPRTFDEFKELLRSAVDVDHDEVAVRMGSALYSKAQRRYQDLEHVRGRPLVLAIEPFFDAGALWRSETALHRFLYGRQFVVEESPGEVQVDYEEVAEHRGPTKTVPSGFFRGTENEAIAAVIFSNSHTTGKFNRIGYQLGYARNDLKMVRWGYRFDPDPGALEPQEFAYEVSSVTERWADGLVIMHNPDALYPLDRGLFSEVTQIWEEEGWPRVDMASPHIYTSVTDLWFESARPRKPPA
jgi:hypothetical protein